MRQTERKGLRWIQAIVAFQRFLAGIVLAYLAHGVLAQQPEAAFRTTTRLVELSVTVSDREGKPLTGLTREDFSVFADGQRRPIAFLQYDGVAVIRGEFQPLPPHVFTNRTEFLPTSARNVTAIVLDFLNSSLSDAYRVRQQVIEILSNMPPDSRVALYHLGSRFQVLHEFTGDMAALQHKLKSLGVGRQAESADSQFALEQDVQSFLQTLSGPESKLWQEQLDRALAVERWVSHRNRAERNEMAFNCMGALADHLKSIPGRKSLIWAGGGLPLVQVYGVLLPGPHNDVRTNHSWIQAASRRLAEANVVLYYYDTRGVMAPSLPAGEQNFYRRTQEDWINADATLGTTWLANNTGGRFVQGSNAIATAFERVSEDLKGSYTLAFYAPDEAKAPWVPLKVQVRGKGVQVRHRDGYPGQEVQQDPKVALASRDESQALRDALRNPLGSSSVLMNARCQPAAGERPGTMQLLLQIDAETLAWRTEAGKRAGALDVVVADISPEGRVFTHEQAVDLAVADADWEQTLRQGIVYQRIWQPHKEATRIRVLVRDRSTGHHGTLDISVSEAGPTGRGDRLPPRPSSGRQVGGEATTEQVPLMRQRHTG